MTVNNYSYFDNATGEYIGRVFDDIDGAKLNRPNGAVITIGKYDFHTHYYDGDVMEYTKEQSLMKLARPGVDFKWSNQSMSWTGKMNSQELYLHTINSDLDYKDHVFQADAKSLSAMQNALVMLNLTGETIDWKTKDNQYVELSIEDLKDMILIISKRNQTAFKSK